MVDFGFAKIVLDKSYTTCGTPEYMAPQLVTGRGHTKSVDHWALGIIIYEMLVGQTPFIHAGATKMSLFRRICSGTFAFPDKEKHGVDVNKDARNLITGLLQRKRRDRLGSSAKNGDSELWAHPWFQGLLTTHKDIFLKQEVTPPWLPEIANILDASYFGSHKHIEEAVRTKKKDAPSKAGQRAFKGF